MIVSTMNISIGEYQLKWYSTQRLHYLPSENMPLMLSIFT